MIYGWKTVKNMSNYLLIDYQQIYIDSYETSKCKMFAFIWSRF